MRSIDLIVVHCSSTPNGVWVSPAQINAWHRERGFKRNAAFAREFRPSLPNIGYHRLVLADGSIAFGRDLEEVGAHVAGHNARSVGICMVGISAYFLHQWEALREVVCTLALGIAERREHPVPPSAYPMPSPAVAMQLYRELGVTITGHRDLSPDADGDGVVAPNEWLKTCPGFNATRWLERGMDPEPLHVLDDHPAIAQSAGMDRAISSMRYGVSP